VASASAAIIDRSLFFILFLTVGIGVSDADRAIFGYAKVRSYPGAKLNVTDFLFCHATSRDRGVCGETPKEDGVAKTFSERRCISQEISATPCVAGNRLRLQDEDACCGSSPERVTHARAFHFAGRSGCAGVGLHGAALDAIRPISDSDLSSKISIGRHFPSA
jgi:hypothetical protein